MLTATENCDIDRDVPDISTQKRASTDESPDDGTVVKRPREDDADENNDDNSIVVETTRPTLVKVPASRFYSRPATDIASNSISETTKRHTVLWLKKISDIRSRIASLSSSDSFQIWKIFPTQSQAFEFAKTVPFGAHVFSFEHDPGNPGKRKFLVTTYSTFWERYSQYPKHERHFYEVIQEGSPCRLYFDLEFLKSCNPNANGDEMTQIFKKIVCLEILKRFGIIVTSKEIVELDSTNDKKFSRHLIFHLKNAVFRDNASCGVFVSELCDKLRNKLELSTKDNRNQDVQETTTLFVTNEKGQIGLFVDEGVYSRNRNFRIYLSCKIKKNIAPTDISILDVSHSNEFPFKQEEEYQFFLKTLVCSVDFRPSIRILNLENQSKSEVGFQGTSNTKSTATLSHHLNYSPYPKIDDYIKSRIKDEICEGYIRSVSFFAESKSILYTIQNYRYCHRIGRHHKSNGIFYVVDLLKGVYYQKCFDPDCRRVNFRSSEWALPVELNPFTFADFIEPNSTQEDDDWFFRGMTDDEIIANCPIPLPIE
ncbi:hypothetical protein BKA69DRAFT_1127308 [Paraphysoderma sedebokerense]|nr:hypothetical protein BKA69DRAFT_1127308 [Paraphysoderma sedebokerense]